MQDVPKSLINIPQITSASKLDYINQNQSILRHFKRVFSGRTWKTQRKKLTSHPEMKPDRRRHFKKSFSLNSKRLRSKAKKPFRVFWKSSRHKDKNNFRYHNTFWKNFLKSMTGNMPSLTLSPSSTKRLFPTGSTWNLSFCRIPCILLNKRLFTDVKTLRESFCHPALPEYLQALSTVVPPWQKYLFRKHWQQLNTTCPTPVLK